MADRLVGGDAVVLFPEGTSSDGIRILPFRSALIGAVHHALGDAVHHDRVIVQPVSIAYVSYGGIPVGRALRDKVAWYGEADLVPHLLNILAAGARRRHRQLGRTCALRHERRSQEDRPRRRNLRPAG